MSSTSSKRFLYPAPFEIPDSSQFVSPFADPQAKKGKEEQDLSFPVTQIDNFQVFTNHLLSEELKTEFLHTGGFSLKTQVSPYIPLTIRVPLHQIKFRSSSSSSSQYSLIQSSPIPFSTELVAQPPEYMDRIVAARYAPLVMPQPLHALPGGYY